MRCKQRMMRVFWGIVLVAVGVGSSTLHADDGWELLKKDRGIVTYKRSVEGREMPTFRGKVTLNASLFDVLAILSDFDHYDDWMHACNGSRLVEEVDALTRISYNRTDAPWPVADRDVVLQSTIKVQAQRKQVRINFRATQHPNAPSVEDVVRMTNVRGYFILRALGPRTTYVRYQVDADPGGSIPTWLAIQASEDIPLKTLGGLRAQAARLDRNHTRDFYARWDPKLNPNSPLFALE